MLEARSSVLIAAILVALCFVRPDAQRVADTPRVILELRISQWVELVNQHDFGGIGIWALGYDGHEPELWQAVEDAFVPASGTVAIR